MTHVIGTPPSDDPPPRGPRHLWTGDWLSESERARRAAEEAAAELERAAAERQATAAQQAAAAPERHTRVQEREGSPSTSTHRAWRRLPVPALAAIVLAAAALAFGTGYLLVGDDTPDPLPAV